MVYLSCFGVDCVEIVVSVFMIGIISMLGRDNIHVAYEHLTVFYAYACCCCRTCCSFIMAVNILHMLLLY